MKVGALSIFVLVLCAAVFGWVSYREYNVEQGRKAYRHYGCAQCHEAGSAPDLNKVKSKYDRAYLAQFIEDPEVVYREKGRRPINAGFMPMPPLHVSPAEARHLADFLLASE
jgi:hypothetical protein